MKRISILTISILMFSAVSSHVYGYGNVKTHPAINKVIVSEFKNRLANYKLNYPTFQKFNNYLVSFDFSTYAGTNVKKGGWYYITEGVENYTISEWIEKGGFTADEPEIAASLRHFYDPVQNEGVLFLTDTGGNPDFNNPWVDAIFWAFEGADPRGNNNWTWKIGKENMILALQTSDKVKKEQFTAKAFRCLGEVLHNTADMGLPAHVRNDAHGGWGPIGGRIDPYESITSDRPDWAATYGVKICDPDLSNYFRTATNAKNINMYLARFTNKYFFSQETISGMGVEAYSSLNGYKNYPTPKLEDFNYKPETFGYYKTFPSGREVKMCVDQSLFMGYISENFRSQPRVDMSCVESQATELLPDIVEAGINVIRNFIPNLKINFTANSMNGEVSGGISHIIDTEYPNTINYSGDVIFWVNGQLSNTVLKVVDGKFSGILAGLKNGDKVIAKIEFADITVSSDPLIAKNSQIATLGGITLKLSPEANSTGSLKVQHFPNSMILTKTNGLYTYKVEISWLTPPYGNLEVLNDNQLFMNQKITLKFTKSLSTAFTYFNGCNLTVNGSGRYCDWQQNNEISLGFICPSFEKYLPATPDLSTASTSFDLPITMKIGVGDLVSNTIDGILIFNGSISDFWSSGINTYYSIEYNYKD